MTNQRIKALVKREYLRATEFLRTLRLLEAPIPPRVIEETNAKLKDLDRRYPGYVSQLLEKDSF